MIDHFMIKVDPNDKEGERVRETLNILGYTYIVKGTDREAFSLTGQMNGPRQIILIGDRMSEEQQISTMLHEILEAVNWHLKIGLDERQVMCLEAGLYQSLTTNGVSLLSLIEKGQEP